MQHFNVALEYASGFAFQETTEEISRRLKKDESTHLSGQPTFATAPSLRPSNQF